MKKVMNKKFVQIIMIISMMAGLPTLHAKTNDLTPIDSQWWINPFAKENPVFYGGPELFASSRMGQVYLPGAGVALLQPMYIMASHSMGSVAALKLSGLATDYVAHVAWRLGCDQGYLGAKELKFNEYPSLDSYFNGTRGVYQNSALESLDPWGVKTNNPMLSHHLNQTISPLGLLFFGAGQVLGQRFFGPFLSEQFSKLSFFRKNMSPLSSATFMDVYGWPVAGGIFPRHQAVGKIGGILMGTYLGWSLNDFGWQMAYWHKISGDTFSEYMPYFGNDDFGSVNKGWGILGFTVGGFLGHNVGASLAQVALSRFHPQSGLARFSKGALIHGTAISGNLALGLTLTTYFPHVFKTIFNKFEEHPGANEFLSPIMDLTEEERDAFLSDFMDVQLDRHFENLYKAHMSAWAQSQSQWGETNTPILPLERSGLEDDVAKYLKQMSFYMKEVSLNMIDRLQKTFLTIKTYEELKQHLAQELELLVPSELVLNKELMITNVVGSIDQTKQLEALKKRSIELLVFIYPQVFKYQLSQEMKKHMEQSSENNHSVVQYLLHKRDIVTLQIKELMTQNPKEAEKIREKFETIHKKLVHDNLDFYKNNPDLFFEYEKELDLLFQELLGSFTK